MSYHLDTSIPVGDAARKVAAEQTQQALEAVSDRTQTVAWRIHELRKCCKKTRALLRLVRTGFPDYKPANRLYRDTARLLSPHRDARVMASLAEHLSPDIYHDPVAHWFDFQAELAEQVAPEPLHEAAALLRDALAQLDGWSFSAICKKDVLEGFAANLKLVRSQSESIIAKPKKRKTHAWRKCIKDHWYQLRLLRNVLPVEDKGRIAAFGDLGELVGDAHDRVVFVDRLDTVPIYLATTTWTAALGKTAAREQKALQKDAIKLAAPLLGKSGKGLVRRIKKSWKQGNVSRPGPVKLVHVR